MAAAAELALRVATDDDGWGLIALIGACWSEYPGCILDVHGECPDLLAPAVAWLSLYVLAGREQMVG